MPLVCVWEQAVLLCYRRSARIGRRSAARCGLRRRQQSLDVARTSSYDARSAGLMRISWTGSPQAAGEEWYFMVFCLWGPWVFACFARGVLLAKAAGAAEEEDLKAGGRCSGHATPLQPRSRMSVGIIFLREIELLVVPNDDTSSSGPSTA